MAKVKNVSKVTVPRGILNKFGRPPEGCSYSPCLNPHVFRLSEKHVNGQMLNKTQCGEGWHQEPWNQPTPFPTQVPQASWQPVNPIQTMEELWDLRGKLHTQKKLFYFIKVTVLHTWQNSSKFSSVICIKMTLGKFQVLSSPESSNSEVTPKQLQTIPKWETSQEADLDTTLVTVSAYNNIFLLSHLENSYSSFKTLLKRGMPLLWNSLYVPWDPQYVIPSAPVPHCNGLLFYT